MDYTLKNIENRTWDYEDIHYWINPADGCCNATIMFNGKRSRLRAGIIILKDDMILLGEEADEPGVFSLPGGGLEENETPLETAIREAQEEVFVNVNNAVDTSFDYCECYDEVKDWVRENVPEEEWWYNYYTCLVVATYDGEYEGKVDKVDIDKAMANSAKWYKLSEAVWEPSFKTQWKKAISAYTSLDEKIVKLGNKWQVQSEKGRNMGTYDTKAEAEKRLKQVEYFKHLNEDTRAQLTNASRNAGPYKDQYRGKNRWERKKYSRVAATTKQFNSIDMNKFFKEDLLDLQIPVTGETANYDVTLQLDKVCEEMQKAIKNNKNIFEYKIVIQALTKIFNTSNIRVKCTCDDYCLHPDTKIKLLDGTTVTVRDLEQKVKTSSNPVYLYSVDDKGDFKPGKIKNVWVSGYADKMIKVTLDNGESIITTENHQYLLRNGQYKEAQYLKVGDSLMPLYFGTTANGYETVKANSKATTEFYSTYKQVANTLLQKEIEEAKLRSGGDKIAIHHKDFNKANNSPENLQPMGVQEHYKYHYEHVFDSGAFDKFRTAGEEYRKLVMDHSTPEYRKQAEVMSAAIKDYWNNLTPEERKKDSERKSERSKQAWRSGSYDTAARRAADEKRKLTLHTPEMEKASAEGTRRYWANLTDAEREQVIAQRKKNLTAAIGWNRGKHLSDIDRLHKSQAALNKTPEEKAEHNRKIRDTKMLAVFNKMLNDNVALTAENYEYYRQNYFKYAPPLNKYFDTIESAIQYFKLNHKIAKIETVEYELLQPVYDIEVEDYHNFYVDAGVILHNCYRFAHWAIVNNYSVDDTAHDPGPGRGIVNPLDDKGKGCKHILCVLNNQDWLIKVANVIRNYILYMAEHEHKLFLKFIFPKLYGTVPEEAVDDGLVADQKDLETSKNIIDTINDWAKNKGKFKAGQQINPEKGKNKLKGPSIDIDETE